MKKKKKNKKRTNTSTTLRCGSFSEKISKKSDCVMIRIIVTFYKSNVPGINLIVGSRNMIKISKNMSL